MSTLGDKIANLLKDKDMSQRDLAKVTGISEGLISEIVNNKKTSTSLNNINQIAKALNVPVRILTDDKVYGYEVLLPFIQDADDIKFILNPKKNRWIKFNRAFEELGYTPERALKVLKKLKELEEE